MLLGAVVVVNGIENAATRPGRRTQQHRRLAAVRPDFHADAVVEIVHGHVVQVWPSSAGMKPVTRSANANNRLVGSS